LQAGAVTMGKSKAFAVIGAGEAVGNRSLPSAICPVTLKSDHVAVVETFRLPGLDPGPRFRGHIAQKKTAGPRNKSGETKGERS